MTSQAVAEDPALPRLVKLRKDVQCCSCGKVIPRGEKAWRSSLPPWHWLNESGEWFSFAEHEICSELAKVISGGEEVAAEPDGFKHDVAEYFIDFDTSNIMEWSENNNKNFGEITSHQWVEFLRGEPSDLNEVCVFERNVSDSDMAVLHSWLDFVYPKEGTA